MKTSKFWQNKESEIFLCQLGYNSIKVYILNMVAEGQHYWQPIWYIYKYMVNRKYTDQLATLKPLCRNDLCWSEALCRNEYTNKLIDWYKFKCSLKNIKNSWIWLEITRLLKKAYYMNMSWKNHFKLQNFNTASWLKIKVDSIFLEQPVLS